jgi:signal transduction histidine kinase
MVTSPTALPTMAKSFWPLSLYKRLALSVSIAFALVFYLMYQWSAALAQHTSVQAEQRLHIELAQHLADDNPLLQDGVYDKSALENLFHTLMLLGPAFEFYYLDSKGAILTYSAKPEKIKRKDVNLAPIQTFIESPTRLPIFGDDPRHATREKIFSVAPIFQGDALQGYLYVIIGGEIYDSVFSHAKQSQLLVSKVLWAGASLTLLLIMLLLLFRYFTSPIRSLVQDMKTIRAHRFKLDAIDTKRWQSGSHNEVEQLGSAFVDMVKQINQQIEQLDHNDRSRRELLAHLSHDLRTPLAAMQGYIEILSIQNDSLSEEERAQHIETITRNASQLKLLIDQIFELAHLEDGQVQINVESFVIGELVHDIMAKFSLTAQKKNIALKIRPQNLQKIVHSDIAKLERILSNLIDNALRHTNENGTIILEIIHKNDFLAITVTDNGSGINAKELAYIFDARFRASNALGKNNQHAGLGLAICKRLCQLLNGELTVESELGNGCKFSLQIRAGLR